MGDLADTFNGWEDDYQDTPEEQWQEGYHTTRDGDTIDLEDMTKSHLENTIAFFKDRFDVRPLIKELKRRK